MTNCRDNLKDELYKMQKEYIKALRPKEKEEKEEEEPQTEAMQQYHSLKMKFKTKGQQLGIKKWKDPTRQSQVIVSYFIVPQFQTMDLLSKFTNKLKASNQQAILFDKKVVVPEPKKEDEEEDDEKKWGVDLDAEDTPGTEWFVYNP